MIQRRGPDLTGKQFGRLRAVRPFRNAHLCGIHWVCVCICGTQRIVEGKHLVNRNTTSCGCTRITHGMIKTTTYKTWQSMWTRTTNCNHIAFRHYGGRGIRVCKRWQRFENFLSDMGQRPVGRTIDRFPNMNGNYKPGNCRWATPSQQRRNKRKGMIVMKRKKEPDGWKPPVLDDLVGARK